jgi:hypothetical protein
MKIPPCNIGRQNERGSATIIFTILLSIMMILILAESRAVIQLRQEQRHLEQRQMLRLSHAVNPGGITNAFVPAAPGNH